MVDFVFVFVCVIVFVFEFCSYLHIRPRHWTKDWEVWEYGFFAVVFVFVFVCVFVFVGVFVSVFVFTLLWLPAYQAKTSGRDLVGAATWFLHG